MQLGSEPDLGVDDAVVGEVLRGFPGHAVQGVPGLHDADRVAECVQVQVEVTAVGASGENLGELIGIMRGQIGIADIVREVDDGPWAQSAVQVVMQQDLGHGADLLNGGAHPAP